MESHKHNDDLIRRKLDSLSIEPSKLNFTTLEANYQKAKKSSSKKWLLIWLLCILSIGMLYTGYQIRLNKSRLISQQNKSANNNNDQFDNTSNSVIHPNTSNETKKTSSQNQDASTSVNINETVTQTNPIPELRSASTSHEDFKSKPNNPLADNSNKPISTETTQKDQNSENSKNLSLSDPRPESKKTEESKNKKPSTNYGANKKTESKSSVTKTNSSEKTENKSSEPLASIKTNSSSTKKSTAGNNSITNPQAAISNNSEKSNIKPSEGKNLEAKKPINENSSTVETSTQTKEKQNNSDTSDTDQKEKTNEQLTSNTHNIENQNTETNPTDSLKEGKDKKPEDEPKTNELVSSATTPTLAPEKDNKHQFFLNTEIVFSNIQYAIKPNNKAESIYNQGSPGFTQRFTDGHTPSSYKLVSGGVSLSYYYKNYLGISGGFGFFNVETQVNAKAFATQKTQTVFDHYIYDSTSQIIDSVYIQKTLGDIIVVNGDTVSAQDYLNNIRFITIPISFSYKLKISRRFSIEPRAGIQIATPIKAYQLIATRTNEFEYKKTKNYMNSKNLFFDLGIQLGYKIGSNAQLYFKQGYFFRNKSIYNVDYALNYSLKSLYTSFGMSILLK